METAGYDGGGHLYCHICSVCVFALTHEQAYCVEAHLPNVLGTKKCAVSEHSHLPTVQTLHVKQAWPWYGWSSLVCS